MGESEWFNTSTAEAPSVIDLEPNIISPTSIIISWKTSHSSQNTIEYGIGNFNKSISMSGMGSEFSYQLSNLLAGSVYQLRIRAISEDETEFFGTSTFQTPPLPSISSLTFQTDESTPTPSLSVTWKTNVDATSSVFYKTEESSYREISSSEKTSDHKILIPELKDSTIYQIYVYGIDQYGNSARSDVHSFSTPIDSRPPNIFDIAIESSNVGLGHEDKSQIVVSWKTDELTTSQVEYGQGLSGDYSFKTPKDNTLTEDHIIIISDLNPGQPYHVRAISTDKGDNTTYSSSHAVISGQVKKSILNLILDTFQSIFGWMGGMF